jgi:transposase-like protein
MSYGKKSIHEVLESIKPERPRNCPRCNSTHIVKAGKNRLKRQRYRCNECKKILSETTNSPLSYTKKSIETWAEYIECMCEKKTIRDSATAVKINKNTSFHWRHKILNGIKEASQEKLGGIIELADVRVNGTVVLCCKDREGHVFSQAASKYRLFDKDLERLLGHIVEDKSVLCVKPNFAYDIFAKKHGYKLYKFISGYETINETFHIRNVLPMCTRLICFVRRFKGMSVKYSNFYFIWFKLFEKIEDEIQDSLATEIFTKLIHSKDKLRICDFELLTSLPA